MGADNIGYAVRTPEIREETHTTLEGVRIIVRRYRDAHGEDAVARDITVHRLVEGSTVGQPIGDARDFL